MLLWVKAYIKVVVEAKASMGKGVHQGGGGGEGFYG